MPVRRDKHGRWFFRVVVRDSLGTRHDLYGTPGVTGPYHDLSNSKVGATEAERRAIADAFRGKQAPVLEAPKEQTIEQLAVGFVDTYKPDTTDSEKRTKRRVLENILLPAFGHLTIGALAQTDIDAWSAKELKRGMSVKTVNNRLAILSSLIKYRTGAKSRLRFKLKAPKVKVRAVTMADVERLLAACRDERYRLVILLAVEAGMRAGEIRGLQWNDVRDGEITIRRQLDRETNAAVPPKHGKPRTVPVSPRIAEALASLKRRGLWVVSCLDGSSLGYDGMLEAVYAVYDRAEVARPQKAMHCLRHTFGTEMAKRVPLPVLRELMGHESITTTMVYVDVNADQKRDAIAAVFGVAATLQSSLGIEPNCS